MWRKLIKAPTITKHRKQILYFSHPWDGTKSGKNAFCGKSIKKEFMFTLMPSSGEESGRALTFTRREIKIAATYITTLFF
jgi:hypothetical protein